MTELEKRVYEVLCGLADTDMVSVHNEYCEKCNYMDDYIERTDFVDELYGKMYPSEALEKFKDMDFSAMYFVDRGYGAECFDYYDDCPVACYEDIARYCAATDNDLRDRDIRDCLDEYYDEQAENETEWDNGGEERAMEHHYEQKFGGANE